MLARSKERIKKGRKRRKRKRRKKDKTVYRQKITIEYKNCNVI